MPRISSQEQNLQRTVEQILEEFGVPRGRGIAKSDDFIQELEPCSIRMECSRMSLTAA